jgi:hypothetical protein
MQPHSFVHNITKVLLFSIAVAVFLPLFARAAEQSVTPAVIDDKAAPRDILKKTITITNPLSHKATFYPVVRNMLTQNGIQEFSTPDVANLSDSLANWIHISRGGIELWAGESKTIDFEIRINLTAKHGIYHAAISFPDGSHRAEAEAKANTAPSTIVNIEVIDTAKEYLEIKEFVPAKKIFPLAPFILNYNLENKGDKPIIPRGEIFIYDRNGKEVGTISVNEDNKIIEAGTLKSFSNEWSGSHGTGKYKAILDISYGTNHKTRVQDTVFFWIIPWYVIALLLIMIICISLGVVIMFNRIHIHEKYIRSQPKTHGHIGSLHADHIPHVVDLRHPPRPKS